MRHGRVRLWERRQGDAHGGRPAARPRRRCRKGLRDGAAHAGPGGGARAQPRRGRPARRARRHAGQPRRGRQRRHHRAAQIADRAECAGGGAGPAGRRRGGEEGARNGLGFYLPVQIGRTIAHPGRFTLRRRIHGRAAGRRQVHLHWPDVQGLSHAARQHGAPAQQGGAGRARGDRHAQGAGGRPGNVPPPGRRAAQEPHPRPEKLGAFPRRLRAPGEGGARRDGTGARARRSDRIHLDPAAQGPAPAAAGTGVSGLKGRRMRLLTLCLFLLVPAAVFAQQAPAPQGPVQGRGIYATIDMGPTLDLVRRLNSKAGGERRPAIREVLKEPSAHTPPVLYALGNALADDDPDDAVFWYHVGRIRAVYDGLRCRDETARHGVTLLGQALNLALRSAQFYQRGNLVGLAQKAIDWDSKNPRNYDQRWIALYGKVAATSAGTNPGEILLPESEWPGILQKVYETHLKSVKEFAEHKK